MIAFLGLGNMGAPMARRLLDAGHKVTVWNRTPKEFPGAQVATSVAEAVRGAELVITMLSVPAAVQDVLTRAAPHLDPRALVVEMSTIGPDALGRVRELLPPGIGLVDAPVLGSVKPAAEGTLTVLAGGSPEDLARCREVLSAFGTVREVGGPGTGAAMKVAVMGTLLPGYVLVAEGLQYAKSLGLDTSTYLDVLEGTPLAAVVGRVRPVVEDGPGPTNFKLALAAKDVELAVAGPGAVQTMAAAARDRYAAAAKAGFGDLDATAVIAAPLAGPPRSRTAVRLNPTTIPPTNGRYSHATRSGDTLFVSGQVALDADRKVIGPDDMVKQSEVVYEYLRLILRDQGCDFDDVTFVRTFMTDMTRIPEHGAVRRRYFTGEPPASTTVGVTALFMPGLLLEVDLVATVPS